MSGRRIHFVSLGCPKNRVDSEVMLGVAEAEGYTHCDDPSGAQVIVVNTCGFIDAAKEESIETILELGRLKQAGQCQKLVVTGCLSQRYPREMAQELPEVDHFLGSSDMLKLRPVLRDAAPRVAVGNPADWVVRASDPRRITTRGASAYVKIAEGCNRSCSFCVIPQLRGKQRSRPADDIVTEVEQLARAGVLEINLISQDTVAYGRDVRGGPDLAALVERVAAVEGVRWVRLFYLYPEKLSSELIRLLAQHPKVLPYIDMPLQHASSPLLRRMRRGHDSGRLRGVVERLRSEIPDVVLRTAFIVGHPGETQSDFEELCRFVEWARFDRVGVFTYSDEQGAASANQDAKVDEALAAERAAQLMDLQQAISRQNNQRLVGRELEVLVEGPSAESELVLQGRWQGQAPEIDGVVYVSGGPVHPGRIYTCRVLEARDFDLMVDAGELDDELPLPAATAPSLSQRRLDGRIVLRTL